MYEQFGFNKDNEYVLLFRDGQVVYNFAQIKFSTRKLFIAEKSRAIESYQKYFDAIRFKRFDNTKYAFRQTLKQTFRTQLAFGIVDDSASSHKSIHENQKEQKINVTRAQRIINFKNDRTNYGRARLIQYLDKQSQAKKDKGRNSEFQKESEPQSKISSVFSMDQKLLQ